MNHLRILERKYVSLRNFFLISIIYVSVKKMKEELRKIQITGGATYTVSIPKKWIKQLGLEAGDFVVLTFNESGSITIYPKDIREPVKEAIMSISENDDIDKVIREFVAYYVLGYDRIMVKFGPNTIKHRMSLKKVIKNKLIGMELLEETTSYMIIQSLVKKAEITIPKAVERLGIIVSFMIDDAIKALIDGDKTLAESVIERDNDVDRLYYFIVRNLMLIASRPNLIKEFGLTSLKECLGFRLIIKSIERAGDHATRIAYVARELGKRACDDVCDILLEMKDLAKKIFENAVNALIYKDLEKAHYVYKMVNEMHSMEKQSVKRLSKIEGDDRRLKLRLVIESLKRFAEYGDELAELAIMLALELQAKSISDER